MECRVFEDNSTMEFHKFRHGIWQNLPQKNGGPDYGVQVVIYLLLFTVIL